MKLSSMTLLLMGILVAIFGTKGSPVVVKRDVDDDISPLNQSEDDDDDDEAALDDKEHGDREKRKIGVVKLGVSNGILNFVFGKLDSFLDAKTKALGVLDESNRAKNAIYGIDPHASATSAFISDIIGKKIQAGTASIGPLINSATTFVTAKGSGLVGALTSKLAPLSSLSAAGGGNSSGGGTSPIAGILSIIPSLSGSSSGGGLSAGISGNNDGDDSSSSSEVSASASAGNNGPYVNGVQLTTESIPEFNRNKVSLDIPSEAFGTGFTTVTNISKIVGKLILNSAHRTESILEVFKPVFRGVFAIKGLPSDNNLSN